MAKKKPKTTKKKPRRRWSIEEKHKLLQEFEEGGELAKTFAAKHGMSAASIYAWLRDIKEGKLPPIPSAGEMSTPTPAPTPTPAKRRGRFSKPLAVIVAPDSGASTALIEDVLRTVARAGNRLGCLALELSSKGVGHMMQAAGLAFEAGRLDLALHLLDEAAEKTAGVAASGSIEHCKQDVTRAAAAVSALRKRIAS